MASNVTTLDRLQALTTMYQRGYQDTVVDLTVKKLVENQLQQHGTKLNALQADIEKYEQQFDMSSEEFSQKFEAGKMGDDADVFEWHILYQMYKELREQVLLLGANRS